MTGNTAKDWQYLVLNEKNREMTMIILWNGFRHNRDIMRLEAAVSSNEPFYTSINQVF